MKFFFGSVIFLGLIFSLRTQAFWPFEKTWSNSPENKTIQLQDDNYFGKIQTQAKTVEDFLSEQKIEINQDDYLFPAKQEKLASGMTVIIRRSMSVSIKVDGQKIELKTLNRTVGQAISEAGVRLSHLDKIQPGKDSFLENDLIIDITRINVEEITEEETIEYETVEKNDPKLKWKKTRIEQEGRSGKREVTYRLTYTNGKQTSKVKLSSKTLESAESRIVYVGTKIEVGKVNKGRASWYAYTGTMACASLQFPRGTWLRVTNQANGKQVIVQVNDSGPYSADKIIDLDKVAFTKLGNLSQGVINVKVEEILE